MELNLKTANKYARKSCTRWTHGHPKILYKFIRRYYRKKYRAMAEEYAKTEEHQELIRQYKEGNHKINTYPWPYSDEGFAGWDEDDSPEGYSLISDQSGCVVKYATSYVAWKIFEATGAWPQKTSSERLDAKRWRRFLKEAGYSETEDYWPRNGRNCVGINPGDGEYGIVVWFEKEGDLNLSYTYVSTYRDKKYSYERVRATDFIWVYID